MPAGFLPALASLGPVGFLFGSLFFGGIALSISASPQARFRARRVLGAVSSPRLRPHLHLHPRLHPRLRPHLRLRNPRPRLPLHLQVCRVPPERSSGPIPPGAGSASTPPPCR